MHDEISTRLSQILDELDAAHQYVSAAHVQAAIDTLTRSADGTGPTLTKG